MSSSFGRPPESASTIVQQPGKNSPDRPLYAHAYNVYDRGMSSDTIWVRRPTAPCADCVLPPDELRVTIADALQRRMAGEFELVLDDPRRAQ
jgi:hypothetical protein